MLRRIAVLAVLLSLGTGAAAPAPKVTRVVIKKRAHSLSLLAGEDVVQTYRVAVGPGAPGHKVQEGDETTPVGRYHVTAHQPSKYRMFLRLDYPNAEDRSRFARLKREGRLASDATIGGDIGIHGPPVQMPELLKPTLKLTDWTLGCIAVNDDEIQEIARLVKDGTEVEIEE